MLKTYGMVVAAFSVVDQANRVRFFKETFLVANVSLEVVFGMFFFILSSADIHFLSRELRWRTYTTDEAFLTTRCIKLVRKKEFVAASLDLEHGTFVIYVASFSSTPHNARLQISSLITKKISTKIPTKYSDFIDIFSLYLASELVEHTRISKHTIKLVNG